METVGFYSSGISIAADLHLPNSSAPSDGYPTVVISLGWGSVKELMVPWGEALAARGFAVLVPDYRGFGGSGGERGRCFPYEHVDDIRAALTFAGQLEVCDESRLALLGVSYGGGIAVAAADIDPRPASVVAVVAYGSGRRHLQAVRTPEQWKQFRARLDEDRRRRTASGTSEEIDPDEILLRDEEARAWRRRVEEQHPHMAFRTTLESAEKIVDFWPEQHLPLAHPTPALFIHAEEDSMVSVEESKRMWQRAAEPKRLLVIPGIGHHEVHHGAAFETVIREVDDWLREFLWGAPDE